MRSRYGIKITILVEASMVVDGGDLLINIDFIFYAIPQRSCAHFPILERVMDRRIST